MNAISPLIQLACRPAKVGNKLVFPYTIRNQGPKDVFVMDAAPGFDPLKRQVRPDPQSCVVLLGSDDYVIIGKFIAPLPVDRTIAMPIVPLAARLPAGSSLERQLEVPTPLAEASPYFPDLPLRRYEPLDIKGVMFTIGYWPADRDNLVASPLDEEPELYRIVTRNTVASAALVAEQFSTKGLQIFKRTDRFPRSLGEVSPR